MCNLSLSFDCDAWVAHLSNEAFPDLDIHIQTDGSDDPPTERQLQAVGIIEQMTAQGVEQMSNLARAWGEENLLEEDIEEMEAEDWEYEISFALVPNLRDSPATYIVFAGRSEIEMDSQYATPTVRIKCTTGIRFMSLRNYSAETETLDLAA